MTTAYARPSRISAEEALRILTESLAYFTQGVTQIRDGSAGSTRDRIARSRSRAED